LSIIDTLITDRAQADVDAVKALLKKSWVQMTPAERTAYLSASKGTYNYTDYNRVGEAVQYLANLLNGYGYAVAVTARTNWSLGNEPSATDRAAYLTDMQTLKNAFYGTTDLPPAWEHLTIEIANNAELLLKEIDTYINCMEQGFRKCGTFKSGKEVILP
jgi:hypothetical protein